ncbi:hypothetical protein AMAG_02122 [Allomyces macrogynus ATCC 38327]|uniref:AAR2 splicing factor homolog n=1 Tax=Allomyces macrogynus (strain ATCC 38327) TaxID=578462 RepID=A0A0L0S172_ALLM3|nr:hypothetical protein AMAG_02122 [Allomyces macrogynus ATCC 38327]|eukprot:KNE56298.1 hypothetical protein AMAG_02122 [Allomyces macrogynus ATCC 38327]
MNPLQSIDMDQETAQHLFKKGAKVVILGLPEQSEFGVDFASWETGPRFKGLEFVPPCLHFIHYRRLRNEVVASASASAPDFRTGFFHWFAESEILVCEWDPKSEDLNFDSELDSGQVQRIKLNIREFDPVPRRPNVDLLGELQLAFLCLLVGQNIEGFEQWKKLMHLICRSVEAIDQMPEFFVKFMGVLRDQLAECPSDFFVDVVSQDNFLITLLQDLGANIADSSAIATHPRFERAVNRLRNFVQKRFEIELVDPFDDEYLDEDRPVVVEL